MALGKKIAKINGWRLGQINWQRFSDGEWYLLIKSPIRNQVAWVLGNILPPGDNLVKLLLLINALKSNGAKEINLIVPYFAYARQDRVDQPGAPISAQAIAGALRSSGIKKILVVDLHSEAIKNYLGKQLIHVSTIQILAKQFKAAASRTLIAAAPDAGAIGRVRQFARILKIPMVWIEKKRPTQQTARVIKIHGNPNKRDAIIFDDLIETGGTILAATKALKNAGAGKIYVAATHGLLVGKAGLRLQAAPIEKIIITNTINLARSKKFKKLKIIDVAQLIASSLKKRD